MSILTDFARPKSWRYGKRPKNVPAEYWVAHVPAREAWEAEAGDSEVKAALNQNAKCGMAALRELFEQENEILATHVRQLIPDFDPKTGLKCGRLIALLTKYCNLRHQDYWEATPQLLLSYIDLAAEAMESERKDEASNSMSAPLTPSELVHIFGRIRSVNTAKKQALELYGGVKVRDGKYKIQLSRLSTDQRQRYDQIAN